MVMETENHLYIMAFKLDEPAKNAIVQIKERKYTQSFFNSPNKILLVDIGFSKVERIVETWEVEEIVKSS